VESKKTARTAESEAIASKEKEIKARAAWSYAAGLATKAQQTLKSMKTEAIALGSKYVSMQKVAGATFAAKAALKISDDRKIKYNDANAKYAQKQAVATAAMAISGSASLLPSTPNTTVAVEKQAADTVKDLRELYANANKGFHTDVTLYRQQQNTTARLRESLHEAHKKLNRSPYEQRYMSHLHTIVLSQRLTQAEEKQNSMETNMEKAKSLAESYHADELAVEASALPAAPSKTATQLHQRMSKRITLHKTDHAKERINRVEHIHHQQTHQKEVIKTVMGSVAVKEASVPQSQLRAQAGNEKILGGVMFKTLSGRLSKPQEPKQVTMGHPWYHNIVGRLSKPADATQATIKTIIGKLSAPGDEDMQ